MTFALRHRGHTGLTYLVGTSRAWWLPSPFFCVSDSPPVSGPDLEPAGKAVQERPSSPADLASATLAAVGALLALAGGAAVWSQACSAVGVRCGWAGSVVAAVSCHLGCQKPLRGPRRCPHSKAWSWWCIEDQAQRPPRTQGHGPAQAHGAVCPVGLPPGTPLLFHCEAVLACRPAVSTASLSLLCLRPCLDTGPQTACLLLASSLLMPPGPPCRWAPVCPSFLLFPGQSCHMPLPADAHPETPGQGYSSEGLLLFVSTWGHVEGQRHAGSCLSSGGCSCPADSGVGLGGPRLPGICARGPGVSDVGDPGWAE